jgi:hypothetical protein
MLASNRRLHSNRAFARQASWFPRVDVEPVTRCWFSSGGNILRLSVSQLTFDRCKTA